MTWTAHTPVPIDREQFQFFGPQDPFQTWPPGCETAATDQVKAARDAAFRLLYAVGRPNEPVTVSISGHANPGHEPYEGAGDEYITVTVHTHRKP